MSPKRLPKERLQEIRALADEPRHPSPGIRAERQADLAEAVPELLSHISDLENHLGKFYRGGGIFAKHHQRRYAAIGGEIIRVPA